MSITKCQNEHSYVEKTPCATIGACVDFTMIHCLLKVGNSVFSSFYLYSCKIFYTDEFINSDIACKHT